MNQEELNALKEEVSNLNEKLRELTEDELRQVTGGTIFRRNVIFDGKPDSGNGSLNG